jgi:hypothetical protein
MKLKCVLFGVVALMFGLASVASASLVTYQLSINPIEVVNALGEEASDYTWEDATDLGGGAKQSNLNLAASSDATCIKCEVRITLTMPSHADFWYVQGIAHCEGGLAVGDAGGYGIASGYDGQMPSVTPAKQGRNSSNNSNIGSSTQVFMLNSLTPETGGWSAQVNPGATSTGNGNGTYGDIASFMHIGATGYGNTSGGGKADQTNFLLAYVYLDITGVTGDAPGTLNMLYQDTIPGALLIIQNNDGGSQYNTWQGMGLASDVAGVGDQVEYHGDMVSVVKVIPEPSTLALLGCSLFGLLAYAWRKRK